MADLTTSLLHAIKENPLPNIDLPEEAIHPQYGGQSILNIPSTVARLLGVPPMTAPPLRAEILDPLLDDDIQTVMVVLVDALALHRLQRWMAEDRSLVWNQLAEKGLLAPLTSVSPSTTSAALTSMWTSTPPAQHGVMGYEVWLKEYGIVTNMIQHKPITYRGGGSSLTEAGFDPHTFLPVEPLAPHFNKHAVDVHALQHYSIINSGLSQMFFEGTQTHAFSTLSDLWISARQLIESFDERRNFVWVYWGSIDGLSHLHGPDDARPRAEFDLFSRAFKRLFFDTLDDRARGRTLLLLTADHGQISTDRDDPHYNLNNHPEFIDLLSIKPTGESRLTYLYPRPGKMDKVRTYIEKTWPGEFHLLDPAQAVKQGLFGPGEPHPRLGDRVGDLIVTAKGDAYWWWADKANPLIGRHGGLTAHDMLVPFLAARL